MGIVTTLFITKADKNQQGICFRLSTMKNIKKTLAVGAGESKTRARRGE